VQDPKTGVYFYEKCLEVSRLTNDTAGEMAANHSLGLVHDKMGDIATATAYHERHQVSVLSRASVWQLQYLYAAVTCAV
jgi:hypothetical protein